MPAMPPEHPTGGGRPLSPLERALTYIGLDVTGPAGALERWLALLLVFIPIALLVQALGLGGGWLFLTSALAIIPLAKLLGSADEALAGHVGPAVGGLLNATFRNTTELIIAFFALQAGLTEVVKASLTGAILGNILFVLGMAAWLGGLRRPTLAFSRTAASVNASQMALAAIGLLIPAAFVLHSDELRGLDPDVLNTTPVVQTLSLGVAAVLIGAYLVQVLYVVRQQKALVLAPVEPGAHPAEHGPRWTRQHAILVFVGAAVVVGVMSHLLVEGVEYLTQQIGLSELFVGVVLVAIIGNAAEHLSAVTAALKGDMDLTVNIAIGSSLQIALFVAPVLVFLGLASGHPMSLVFGLFELVAIGAAIFIVNLVASDGEMHWFEGIQLLAAYGILAVAFYFLPE